jgi:hypothetical protein
MERLLLKTSAEFFTYKNIYNSKIVILSEVGGWQVLLITNIKIYYGALMKTVVLFLLLGCFLTVNAQTNNGSGSIKGVVADSLSHKGLHYATVRIFSKDSNKLIDGAMTDSLGRFEIDNITYSAYNIKISFMGYRTKSINSVALNKSKNEIKLDTITLSPLTKEIKGVEITGEKQEVEFSFDKLIMNVDMMPEVKGGALIDIFKNTPNLMVEGSIGNYSISLNGSSSITYFIDGRPVNDLALVLQMPSSSIERVEVISNPSAKYDAEGEAGIINIIKRPDNNNHNNNDINGMASLSASNRDNYSSSIKLNYKKDKINYYLNYDNQFSYFEGLGTGNILTTVDNITTLTKGSAVYSVRGFNHYVELGADCSIDSSNSILFSFDFNKGNRKPSDKEILNKYTNDEPTNELYLQNYNAESEYKGNNFDLSLNYKKKFSKKGKEVSADLYYTGSNDNENNALATIMHPFEGAVSSILNNYATDRKTKFFMAQSDFVLPLDNNGTIEGGVKGLYRNRNLNYTNLYYSFNDNLWEDSLHLSDAFHFDQYIYSVYATYANKLSAINYKIGLRSEYTNQDIKQNTLDLDAKSNYIDFFPSANVNVDIVKNILSVSAGYSRRINRPDMMRLNPYIQTRTSTYIMQGNASLKPEYIDNITIEPNWGDIYLSLYYRRTKDNIVRVSKVIDDSVQFVTYDNASKADQYGINIYKGIPISKIGRVSISGGYFHKNIKGFYSGEDLSSSTNSWNARINTGLKLGWDVGLNISMSYQGPRQEAQIYTKGYFGSNLTLVKQLFDKKGAIALNINDPFKLAVNKDETKETNYYFYHEFKMSFTMVSFSFSYSFDNFKEVGKKWLDEDTGSKEYEKK